MAKSTLLYDLGALVTESLVDQAPGLAEALGRPEPEVTGIIAKTAGRYASGEITQAAHWEDAAFYLGLDDTDLLGDFALAGATVDRELLGRARVQAGTMTIGLVSDATPDWVGHFRRTLKLDDLFHANIIGSELDEEQSYSQLLGLAAARLQAHPGEVWFVDRKPAHLTTATAVGMRGIDLATAPDYRAAFAALPRE